MNKKPKKSKAYIYIISAILICILVILGLPMIIRNPMRANEREAIINGNSLRSALFEFENDYGSYPDAETAKDVTDAFPNHGYDFSGNSSNAVFRQLIASGIVNSEDIFYLQFKGSKKPDGDISPGHALEKGECNYAYIAGQSTSGNPSRPLLISPVIPGTKKIDTEPYDGIAIVVKIDGSASALKFKSDGQDIFSPTHPMWKGVAPDIRYPE